MIEDHPVGFYLHGTLPEVRWTARGLLAQAAPGDSCRERCLTLEESERQLRGERLVVWGARHPFTNPQGGSPLPKIRKTLPRSRKDLPKFRENVFFKLHDGVIRRIGIPGERLGACSLEPNMLFCRFKFSPAGLK